MKISTIFLIKRLVFECTFLWSKKLSKKVLSLKKNSYVIKQIILKRKLWCTFGRPYLWRSWMKSTKFVWITLFNEYAFINIARVVSLKGDIYQSCSFWQKITDKLLLEFIYFWSNILTWNRNTVLNSRCLFIIPNTLQITHTIHFEVTGE